MEIGLEIHLPVERCVQTLPLHRFLCPYIILVMGKDLILRLGSLKKYIAQVLTNVNIIEPLEINNDFWSNGGSIF